MQAVNLVSWDYAFQNSQILIQSFNQGPHQKQRLKHHSHNKVPEIMLQVTKRYVQPPASTENPANGERNLICTHHRILLLLPPALSLELIDPAVLLRVMKQVST